MCQIKLAGLRNITVVEGKVDSLIQYVFVGVQKSLNNPLYKVCSLFFALNGTNTCTHEGHITMYMYIRKLRKCIFD